MINKGIEMDIELSKLFPHGIAGIIYDCDGVMIDSLIANRHFYNLVLSSVNLPPITEEQERFAFQATAQQAFEHMLPESLHHNLDEIIRKAVNYDQDVLPKIKLMPHYRDFVVKAHKFNLRQAIDTNRTDIGIKKVIDYFELPPYFNPVISSTGTLPKPSPEGALKICKDWEVSPQRVLFVGDSADDGLAAKGAGCIFAAFGGKGLDGDIQANDFESLGKLLWPFCEKISNHLAGE